MVKNLCAHAENANHPSSQCPNNIIGGQGQTEIWITFNGNKLGCLGLIAIVASALICMVKWRIRKYTLPPPEVPVAQTPAEVRVKAAERKPVRPMGSDPMDAPNEYYFKHWPPNNGNKCPENP